MMSSPSRTTVACAPLTYCSANNPNHAAPAAVRVVASGKIHTLNGSSA